MLGSGDSALSAELASDKAGPGTRVSAHCYSFEQVLEKQNFEVRIRGVR